MPKKVRKHLPASRRSHPPRSREMLLPMPASAVRACQLENHVALAALLKQQGNIDLVGRLLRVVYMSSFLRKNYDISYSVLSLAEQALKVSIVRAADDGVYFLDDAGRDAVAEVLSVYDSQLTRMPMYVIEEANARLVEFASAQASVILMADNEIAMNCYTDFSSPDIGATAPAAFA